MRIVLLVFVALFMTACSDNNEPQKVEKDHVWKEQTDMIDKAKNVENVLKDAAKLQQQKINEQTQ